MITMVGLAEAPVVWSDRPDGPASTVRYFGKGSTFDTTNSAHRTEAVNREVGAHFHAVDQFQLFLGAPGAVYARRPLTQAFTIHYSDAYRTYGPFSGADQPLVYFTLRGEHSSMTGYMPGAREGLRWVGRRHHLIALDRLDADGLPPAGTARYETLIERESDGLGAYQLLASPGASFDIPNSRGTGGQYVFVAEGDIELNTRTYPAESVGWQDPGSDGTSVRAGDGGTRLFVMCLPNPSTVDQRESAGSA